MSRISIADLDDPQLTVYRELPRANLTALSGRFIVEGKWLVERLVASDFAVESVLVDERNPTLVPAELNEQVPVYVLAPRLIQQLVGFNFHRGILACGRRRPLVRIDELLPRSGSALFVACIDIHDPTNLGGILRNCAAFGVHGVLLSRNCADPFSRRVLRVSMGTAFKLRIATLPDLPQELQRLRTEYHFQLFATVLATEAERLESSVAPERMVLLIGNEGHGLPAELVTQCDRRVTLPMSLETDSLNAAAASAVFLYHFTRIGSSLRSGCASSAN
jgi:tRNA G18 (ribose-2'-O)-methylase SpoU